MKNLLKELEIISKLLISHIKKDEYYISVKPNFLKKAIISYPLLGGKRIRPALLLWSCGLLGGDINEALNAAVAAEIHHNWTLVHDDIIDEDKIRRGKLTIHSKITKYGISQYGLDVAAANKFGIDFAILVGDIQQAWANYLLLQSVNVGIPFKVVIALCNDLLVTTRELLTGEALDINLSYCNINKFSIKKIEQIIYLKTVVLFNFCIKAGAKIALRTTDDTDIRICNLLKFSNMLGTAFQLRDDWLDIYGNELIFGKPIGSDICKAKPTLLIFQALKMSNSSSKLLKYLGKKVLSKKELAEIRSIITKSGSEKMVLDKINYLNKEAEKLILQFSDNKYRTLLLELNNYLIGRYL